MVKQRIESIVEPKILEWARVTIGKTVEDASKNLKVGVEKVQAWEAGSEKPSIWEAEKMAILYKRPMAIFYLQEPPVEKRLKDFRKIQAGDAEVSTKVELVRRRAIAVQEFATELDPIDLKKEKLFINATVDEPVNDLVKTVKGRIGFESDDFISHTKTSEDAYRYWRNLIENSGVLVLQAPFPIIEARAFSIFEKNLRPVMVINTKDAINGRIFSLFHELCHIVLRTTGICDMSDTGNVETYCNKFSAEFLVPLAELTVSLPSLGYSNGVVTDELIEKIAKKFRVSQQVAILRLLAAGIVDQKFYDEKKTELDRMQRELEEIRKTKNEKKPLMIPQSTKCFSYNGTRLVGVVIDSYSAKKITLSDVVRYLDIGAKHVPKIQKLLNKGVKADL